MIDSDYTGQYVKITGWGRVQVEGKSSQFLRQATLKVMSFAACKNTSFGDHITESMICAYNDNTDACQVLCHDQFNFSMYFGIKILNIFFYCIYIYQ